ncbi:MAG: RhuM family protein [Methanobacteriaceae archaeon]
MTKDKIELMETLLYIGLEGAVSAKLLIDKQNETLWASQKTIASIFGTTSPNISQHFFNIFEERELSEKDVSISAKKLFEGQEEFIKKSLINSKKGGRPEKWYNLDGIIAVGYRVNSKEATQFRIWATSVLKEYMIKGFVLDNELLKNGTRFGKDYFDELLGQIREIRGSERRFNQKIAEIYITSYDYNPKAEISKEFFATVQNKLIYAVSGKTAAELIAERSDSNKLNMGLTNWKTPNGKIVASDVVIAKNYLNKIELERLNRTVDGFLTLAENRAQNHIPTSMNDWKEVLISYIKLNQLPELTDKGKISSENAKEIAKTEYYKFRPIQDKDFKSDFDKMINEIKRIEGHENN